MLSQRDLRQLALTYRECDVLSVYFIPRSDLHHAAGREERARPWVHAVERLLGTLRLHHVIAGDHERTALEAALARFDAWCSVHAPAANAPGFVVFVSTEGVLHADATVLPVRPGAFWQKGAHLAPLLGEVSLAPVAAVLVVDERHVHLHSFQAPGQLLPVETLAAGHSADAERRMGSALGALHAVTHPATHAATHTGAATERLGPLRLAAAHHLHGEAMRRADAIADPAGWIVLAGSAGAVAAASAVVPRALAWRTITLTPFEANAAAPDMTRAVARVIAEHEARRDREVVREILAAHGSRGGGVAGLAATRTAVARDGVATLLLSQRFVEQRPQEADALLAEALARGASVRQIGGVAAREADLLADGVAARLRYRVNDSAASLAP